MCSASSSTRKPIRKWVNPSSSALTTPLYSTTANTPKAWAAKLIEIAARKDRLPALSASARAFVETTYDTGRNIGLYEARFRDLAGRGVA